MADRGDEPITPAGRFFLNPTTQQIINCSFGMKNPIVVDAMKAEIQNTLVRKHPRFSSILTTDEGGRQYWRKVDEVDIEKHVVVVPREEEEMGGPSFVDDYVAGLAISASLDASKPLWEAHLLLSNRCCVLRLHHALGDGVSLMSLFLACCQRAQDPSLPLTMPRAAAKRTTKTSIRARALEMLLVLWYTFIYVVGFFMRVFWTRDETTPISGGEGVELWPRKLRTVTFKLADLKIVKNSVGGTINDVVLGMITLALEKYLEPTATSKSAKPVRVTGLTMVNTRALPGLQELADMMKRNTRSRWGNNFGYIILPLYLWKGTRDGPLEYVARAKEMTDKKKLSLEALFSYKSGALIMSLLGPQAASRLNYRVLANTTFTLSNLTGPSDEVMFAGNPITHIRTTATSLPHALTMHMISYMDKVDMQILVAKDIIPDPDVLAKCFEDALSDMKACAMDRNKKEF